MSLFLRGVGGPHVLCCDTWDSADVAEFCCVEQVLVRM